MTGLTLSIKRSATTAEHVKRREHEKQGGFFPNDLVKMLTADEGSASALHSIYLPKLLAVRLLGGVALARLARR